MARGGSSSGNVAELNDDADVQLELKPTALTSLTQKIEANLKKGQNGNRPGKGKKNAVLKPQNDIKSQSQATKARATGNESGSARKPHGGAPKATISAESASKKRTRDGQLKPSRSQKPLANEEKRVSKGEYEPTAELSKLEKEILELGGSKDDLALIGDLESESELDGDQAALQKPGSKGLQKDLQRLVQELGIEKVSPESGSESLSEQKDNGFAKQDEKMSTAISGQKGDVISKESKSTKGKPQYVLEPQPEWYAATLPAITATSDPIALPADLIARVHEHAKSLLEKENERYASRTGSANSDRQFYSTIMSSGTLSDKISALTLSIQESPLHSVKALETLVGLARKRSRGQAVEVLGALKDMFGLGSVLPPDRKLRNFAAQPDLLSIFSTKMKWTSNEPLPKPLTEAHLVFWAFEDWLKTTFFDILKILETWCNDEVVYARGKAVDYVCQLLKEKPEQEANLLRLLVNKLGDSDKKIASKTSYHILQLETAHPLMKSTIVSAIESDLLFRPGQSLHAQYYAVITLNQTILSSKEEEVSKKLLDIYFSLFAKLLAKPEPKKAEEVIKINQKGEIQGGGGPAGRAARRKAASKEKATAVEDDLREKMLSAVLTGVNRAVPYTNTSDESFEKHLDTLFQITHSSNFNTSIQALMLIQQLNGTHQSAVDRYYRTLYESLLDPRLLTSSKQALYLNLLFKSLRSDLNIHRIKAFTKRLLQVLSMHQPSFVCGALYMLRELEGIFPTLTPFIDDPEANESDEEETFYD
ncbi:MAG: hypothetical protein Q9174_006382, partial [Haloplaca sp. 1 TL-2023]